MCELSINREFKIKRKNTRILHYAFEVENAVSSKIQMHHFIDKKKDGDVNHFSDSWLDKSEWKKNAFSFSVAWIIIYLCLIYAEGLMCQIERPKSCACEIIIENISEKNGNDINLMASC